MMTANYKIQDAAGWTMFIFGVLALLLGILGLLRPELVRTLLGFNVVDRSSRATGDYTLMFMIAASMASFNMGIYYVLASLNNMKSFYKWTVPFRCVTFVLFTTAVLSGVAPLRFLSVGAWELTGAVTTGWALWQDKRK